MTSSSTSRLRRKIPFCLETLNRTYTTSLSPEHRHLIQQLKSCENARQISRVHCRMVKTGLDQDAFASSKLLACSINNIQYAASIFKNIQNPNLFMFNTILRGYSISDDPKQAFGIFNRLRKQEGIKLDQFSFVTILKACSRVSDTEIGKGIHGIVLRCGFVLFCQVKNTLLHFYGVCGGIEDARKVFDEFPEGNDSVSFNTLMGGYVQAWKVDLVVDLFKEMRKYGLLVSVSTLLSVLPAAGGLGDLSGGESVHGYCVKTGFDSDVNLVTALIDMYAKTGNVGMARRIFDTVGEKDVVLWNCMIDKYAKSGLLEESLALLRQMRHEQVKPNSSTLVGLLSSCAAYEATNIGRCLGDYVEEEGLALDAVLGTALVDMYAKLGFLDKAVDIFDRIESKDVKSWTAMISGYGAHGLAGMAVELFFRMEEERFKPNVVTFLAVLSACSHRGFVVEGMRCFERMVKEYGFMPKVEHYGCVIDLLGRAGLLEEAYNLIIRLPVRSDSTAWRALLAACRVYGDVRLGERVKEALAELGERHPTDSILLSGTYAVAGSLQDQTRLLEENTYKEKKEAGCSSIEME